MVKAGKLISPVKWNEEGRQNYGNTQCGSFPIPGFIKLGLDGWELGPRQRDSHSLG